VTIASGFGKVQWLRLRKKQDTSLWRGNEWERRYWVCPIEGSCWGCGGNTKVSQGRSEGAGL
jgi:hypothetical protein